MSQLSLDLELREQTGGERARAHLTRVVESKRMEQARVLRAISEMKIEDRLDLPEALDFGINSAGAPVLVYGGGTETVEEKGLHENAQNQLTAILGVPKAYYTRLLSGDHKGFPLNDSKGPRQHLLTQCMNTHLKYGAFTSFGKDKRLLSRVCNGEVRGILSDRYNLTIPTPAMVSAFMRGVRDKELLPYHAQLSPVRVMLQAVVDEVFEPVPGEYVLYGVSFSTSDFGSGRLCVRGMLLRVYSGSGMVVDQGWTRVHLGKLLDDASVKMSDDTYKHAVATNAGLVYDSVNEILDPKHIDHVMQMVVASAGKALAWGYIERSLRGVLSKAELDELKAFARREKVSETLPPLPSSTVAGELTGWWLGAWLGQAAAAETDCGRREDLELAAGTVLAA